MSFLGLMTVASHINILTDAKADAFGEGVSHQQKITPIYQNRQPEIDSLKGQLDAAVELKDGYLKFIEQQKDKLNRQAEITADYIEDAVKWRNRNERERARQQVKRASKSKAGAKK